MRTEPFGEPARTRAGARRLSLRDKEILTQALQAVDVMSSARRQAVLAALRDEIDPERELTSFPNADSADYEIIQLCLPMDQMDSLVGAMRLLGGNTTKLKAFEQLVRELLTGVLDPTDRLRLQSLLREVPQEDIDAAVQAAGEAAGGDLGLESPLAYPRVLELVEHAVVARGGSLEPLWVFLETVAHRAGDVAYEEFDRTISAAARMVGETDFQLARQVCVACSARAEPDPPGDAAGGNADGSIDPAGPGRTEDVGDDDESGDDVDTGAAARLRPKPRPPAAPAIWGGVPPRNPFFAGRSVVLDDLRHALHPSTRAAVLPGTLHGLGGIGKTHIAIEFAHRFRTDYDLIWWVPAVDELSIRRSLASLGRRLGLSDVSDQQFLIDSVLDELRLSQRYPRWLVVFDNAAEPGVVKPYLPSGAGHVLLTSRDRSWVGSSSVVEVGVFDPEESRQFLAARWQNLSPEQADTLAGKLGHIPLALAQAVAVHEQSGLQLEDYLALLDDSPVELLDQSTATDYPLPVASTWKIAFDQLAVRSPGAAQLLQLCAFLSDQPISIPMLRGGRGAALPSPLDVTLLDELTFRRAVQDIGKFALAQLDPVRDFITLHMLVSAVLRGVLPEPDRAAVQRQAHEVLALANPGSPDRSETWTRHARIAPHVIPSGLIGSTDPHCLQVVIDQVRYFFAIGDFVHSEALARLAHADWATRLGEDDLSTLRLQFHLGNALRVLGSYEEARALTETTLRVLQAKLGPEHEFTLQVANSLTADLRLIGEFAQALELDEQNLERHRAVLGPADHGVLRAANNLAVDYRLAGSFQLARDLDQESLTQREALDPAATSPETLLTVNNLVRDIYGLGDYGTALKLQVDQLQWFETRLRADHRTLLLGRRNMSILWRRLGNYSLALRQAEVDAETCRHQLGPSHEHTLAAQTTLFNTLRASGDDLIRAANLAQETWDAYRDRFGTDHPATLACAVDTAIVLRALGDHEQARQRDDVTHAALSDRLGPDHQYTLCAEANRANNAAVLDGPAAALALTGAVLERSRRVRGPDHPYTLACAANHALDLAATGEHAEAARLRAEVLSSMQLRLGPEHPQTVTVERGRRTEADIEFPPM